MLEIKLSTLKKITTRYDASKVFNKSRMIFFCFKSNDIDKSRFKYLKFNPEFDFNKNFDLCMESYKDFTGHWNLYTNNEKYPIVVPTSSKNIQQEFKF